MPRRSFWHPSLTPVWHTSTKQRADVYKTEPYVVAADVYAEPPHVGRRGRQQRFCVSAHAHRPIDQPARAARSHQERDLVHEDGNVNPRSVRRSTETMPTNACQHFYVCASCQALLRPRHGDCCVFCSYADHDCPPKQAAA